MSAVPRRRTAQMARSVLLKQNVPFSFSVPARGVSGFKTEGPSSPSSKRRGSMRDSTYTVSTWSASSCKPSSPASSAGHTLLCTLGSLTLNSHALKSCSSRSCASTSRTRLIPPCRSSAVHVELRAMMRGGPNPFLVQGSRYFLTPVTGVCGQPASQLPIATSYARSPTRARTHTPARYRAA